MSHFLLPFLFLSNLPYCLSLSKLNILRFSFVVSCDTLILKHPLLPVGTMEGGFPSVESGGWNGETRQGEVKPK